MRKNSSWDLMASLILFASVICFASDNAATARLHGSLSRRTEEQAKHGDAFLSEIEC